MNTITLRHASPTRNRLPISQGGLLHKLARDKMKVVWLHAAGHSLSAVEHVAMRHDVEPIDVSVWPVTLSLADPRLKRCSKRGWYYYTGDIDPSCLGRPAHACQMLTREPWKEGAA